MINKQSVALLEKYNVPGPRYTSYPTFPSWKGIKNEQWFTHLKEAFNKDKTSISLYIHVPFCESLCSFCGCTKMITKNHELADEYITAVHREFRHYEKMIPEGTDLFEIHLGGGSPTWLKPHEIEKLLKPIKESKKFNIDPSTLEQSIEMDPRTTTPLHCKSLSALGFTRASLGIQDTNPKVLKHLHRDQPLEMITNIVEDLKRGGIKYLNLDLIYGLPYQTTSTIDQTIQDILVFKPSRIALYSYAHVPTLKPAQKLLEREGLPLPHEKMMLQKTAKEKLQAAGYVEIGMDHFALPTDSLYTAIEKNTLHRNFMGYTVLRSKVLLGLGPSSLSDTWTAFAQNEKDYKKWREDIMHKEYSLIHGHALTTSELLTRKIILNMMCNFETDLSLEKLPEKQLQNIDILIADNLIIKTPSGIKTTEIGKQFIRNICMVLDDYSFPHLGEKVFSQTV